MKLRTVALVIALLALSGTPLCANLLTNGSFETGDFTGWTQGGNLGFTSIINTLSPGPHDGVYYLSAGPIGSDGTISQTISDIAGATYVIAFWLNATGSIQSDVNVSWNGSTVLSLTNPNTGGVWAPVWVPVTGTGSDTVELGFRNDPSFLYIDAVSVETPEPTSFFLIGGGLIAVAIRFRRR